MMFIKALCEPTFASAEIPIDPISYGLGVSMPPPIDPTSFGTYYEVIPLWREEIGFT